MRQTSARPGAAVLAVMACGLAAGCTVAGPPAAAGSPAGAPFVYVTGKGGTNEISQFATLGSGALRPLTPRNVASGEFPYDVAVSPQGTSAYAVDNLSNTAGAVSQYTLNPATGKLTPKSPRTVATAGVPSGIITVSPDGKNAYVPSGKAISQYRISPGHREADPHAAQDGGRRRQPHRHQGRPRRPLPLHHQRHAMPRAEGQQGQQVHRQRQGKHRLGVRYQPGHRRAER